MTAGTDASGTPVLCEGPLSGVRVLVTRAPHQAAALAGPLTALGAEVLVAPVIDTVDPDSWEPADRAIAGLSGYDWVILTSTNAVDRFLGRMAERDVPLSALHGVRVAAVGPATAERLAEAGITPDLVPEDFRAEGLVEALLANGIEPGARLLLPRAEHAREILPDALRAAGAVVDVVPVYRTVPASPDPALIARLAAGEVDVVTFTSPSTVRHFVTWVRSAGLDADAVMAHVAPASIGPVTSDALRGRGYTVAVEPSQSTTAALVDAIGRYVEKHRVG